MSGKNLLLFTLLASISVALETEYIFAGLPVSHPIAHPYQVSIQIGGWHLCGGALIANNLVLTAAHCFATKTPEFYRPYDYTVVAGTADLQNAIVPANSVSYIYLHKNFKLVYYDGAEKLLRTILNDIAVLKLKDAFNIGYSSINVIKLPDNKSTSFQRPATVTGFGYNMVRRNPHPTSSQDQYIPYSDQKLYSQAYKILSDLECPSDEQHICAKPLSEPIFAQDSSQIHKTGICQGDSGSPLVVSSGDNWTIVGIASYAPGPCDSTYTAGHFTKVSYYLDWIKDAMQNALTPYMVFIDVAEKFKESQRQRQVVIH